MQPAIPARPRIGYLMASSAAVLWALNGTVSKVLLASGFSSLRLAQVRTTGALIGLGVVVVLTAPSRLRAHPRELPFLAAFGIVGLALVQWFYFLAIHRLAIGIALLIQYLAPLLVAVWTRVASRSSAGILFSALAAITYALYILLAEHAVPERDAASLLAWGFGFAALSATRVGIVAMLEPVVATAVAWAWLGESLAALQLLGGSLVLVAIGLAQTRARAEPARGRLDGRIEQR